MVEVSSVATVPRRHLVVVEEGRRRLRLDLPGSVVEAIRQPARALDNAFWLDPADQQLIDVLQRDSVREMPPSLRSWLHTRGRAAFALEEECLDAAAILAAAVVAAELNGPTEVAIASLRRLAVWLAWQAGLRAARSTHVEPLVAEWIRHPERLAHGEWQRLTQVAEDLQIEVSLPKAREIAAFSRGILSRSTVRSDPELTAISCALLKAVGEDQAVSVVSFSVPTRLAGLVAMGRALVPPGDAATSQSRLLPAQLRTLRSAFTDFAADQLSIPLLPPALPWPQGRVELGADLLQSCLDTLDKL